MVEFFYTVFMPHVYKVFIGFPAVLLLIAFFNAGAINAAKMFGFLDGVEDDFYKGVLIEPMRHFSFIGTGLFILTGYFAWGKAVKLTNHFNQRNRLILSYSVGLFVSLVLYAIIYVGLILYGKFLYVEASRNVDRLMSVLANVLDKGVEVGLFVIVAHLGYSIYKELGK